MATAQVVPQLIAGEGAEKGAQRHPFDLQHVAHGHVGCQQQRYLTFEEGAEYQCRVAKLADQVLEHAVSSSMQVLKTTLTTRRPEGGASCHNARLAVRLAVARGHLTVIIWS